MNRFAIVLGIIGCYASIANGQTAFVNWENPHVHPVDLTPDGSTLLAVNTADNRLEVYDVTSGMPIHTSSIPVGIDPVSVRARTDTEVWVVNHISDSVSVVSLSGLNVIATIKTNDEPADVVFAGSPQRAFISCSQANTVMVFDPNNLATAPTVLNLDGEDPRAMAVGINPSNNHVQVYVAIFESGNRTTILGGGLTMANGYPPNAVNDPLSPYGNSAPNPPPNAGPGFNPPINPAYLPGGGSPAPKVGLIVRKNSSGHWVDDNNHDWTDLTSGANASHSGRPVGWDLFDHDIAIIDVTTLGVQYANGLMNICMALAVNPANQQVTLVGTDATNQIRFEPVVDGRFIRVNLALVSPATPATPTIVDLNSHLTYGTTVPFVPIAQSERNKSIGDPRGIVWNAAGTRGYVTGMGSNNVVIIDANGNRQFPANNASANPYINVGEGPTGLALDETRHRLYVLNKFEADISVINTVTETELNRVPLFDPTSPAIKIGRKHLYDTHRNSGLGQIACASCHVDGRMDRLAWDLGDPQGAVKTFNENCPAGGCQPWHPMKGPMTTQTLQDIIGKEPHHWRGDREGIEAFSNAFHGLLGADNPLPAGDMQQFEDFLATIRIPPNPFRNFDNSLPTNVPLTGQFSPGRFAGSGGRHAGDTMPDGNAVNGLTAFRTANLDSVNCVTCHTTPTGAGTDSTFNGIQFTPFPVGPNGEHHLAMVAQDGSTNISIKIPQLRNQYEKIGFEATKQFNRAGFGFLHDGSVDSIARFVSEPVFSVSSDQQVSDLVALTMAFAGSDYPPLAPSILNPPGVASLDTHAAVGTQITVDANNKNSVAVIAMIASMKSLADANKVGWIAKGVQGGLQRGGQYIGGDIFQTDRAAETITTDNVRLAAGAGSEITFTIVAKGTERRLGIDRDSDGHFDRDELDACANPADPNHIPGMGVAADFNCDAHVDVLDLPHFQDCQTGPSITQTVSACLNADLDHDGDVDADDFALWQRCVTGPNASSDPNCMN